MNRGVKIFLGLLLPLLLAACTEQKVQEKSCDVLTQTVISEKKTVVTVLVKYAFSIQAFEKAVEEKFPQLDLIQVGNYTRDRGIVEYGRRMEHDDLPDVVMTWPLEVGEKYWGDRLIDLSSMPFTSRYSTAMLNSIARDGKLYYLPGPAQVRGIVYNKTLFAERGWKVPHDFQSFVALCQKIEANGIRSLQLGFGNAEVLDTALVGFGYGGSFSTPADAQWLADFNSGKVQSTEHLRPALETFQAMIDAGIWKRDDLQVTYAQREQMIFNRRSAMVEDSLLLARMGHAITGTSDKFALMPFFNPGTPSDWARLYMVCYIGLNKHLQEPRNKEKYELILQVMDYISTPEGQEALAADTGAMYSSLRDVPPPDAAEIIELNATLNQGRYAVFPEMPIAQDLLRQGMAGMLAGTVSIDNVLAMIDPRNTPPRLSESSYTLGTASADFSLTETGNLLTDVMRSKSGADIALFLDNGKDGRFNGKGLSARLYKGPQTMDDVLRILPDTKLGEKGELQVVTMTGTNLLRTLEHAITVNNDGQGWFYYFSGLRMEYAPAAAPGKRVRKVTTTKGELIDPKQIYSIAVMDKTIPSEYALSMTDTGQPIWNILAEAIRASGVISPSNDGRFVICEP